MQPSKTLQVDSHRQPLRCVSLVDGHSVPLPHQQGQGKPFQKGVCLFFFFEGVKGEDFGGHTDPTSLNSTFLGGRNGSHKINLLRKVAFIFWNQW